MENSSTNGEDSTEEDKHTPPYIVGSSAESDNGNIIAAVDSTPLMTETRPKKVGFRKSTMLDSAKIIHEIIIPSYFQFVKQFKWIYVSTTSRYYGISSQYTRFIESIINQPPSYNYSFVIYDESDYSNIVGHILLAPPHPIKGSLSPNRYEISRDLYILTPIYHGIGTMWRQYQFQQAVHLLKKNLELYVHRYWSCECIAIKPIWQSNGYGTILLSECNKYIENKTKNNNDSDFKVPIITLTTTEKALKFYQNFGYQTFLKIVISKRQNLVLYGLLYHFDDEIKKKWMSILKDNIEHQIYFSNSKHVLPQTIIGWLQLLIISPFLMTFLFISYILRCCGGFDKTQ